MAAVGRGNQRRPTEAVRARQVGICSKDGLEDLYVAGLAGRQERVRAHVVQDVDIGAGFDQRFDHLEIVGVDGCGDRSPSLRVSRVDVHAAAKQLPDGIEISTGRGLDEARVLVPRTLTATSGHEQEQREHDRAHAPVSRVLAA